jgi:hypothetical protein
MLIGLEGAHAFYVRTFGRVSITFALTSEKSPQADIAPRRVNVAEVPEADVRRPI